VNVGDLGILAVNWGRSLADELYGASYETGDFDGDDAVNVSDLGVLAMHWGWRGVKTDAGASVPEPLSALTIAMAGALLLPGRRRRARRRSGFVTDTLGVRLQPVGLRPAPRAEALKLSRSLVNTAR